MTNSEELVAKLVDSYFNEPDKTLKEVFAEYAEDLDEESRVKFFKTLEEIVN